MADSTITVNIKGPSEIKLTITVESDATVKQLKEEIAKQKADVPVESQRLIYAGKVLKDEQPLSDYKLQNNHTVHLVKSASRSAPTTGNPTTTSSPAASAGGAARSGGGAAGAGAGSTPSSGSGAAPAAASASAAQGVPSNFGAGQQFANNPMAALNRADLAGPHMANLGRNLFQQNGMNPADPNMMMNALDSPDFQNHMRSMLRRPEVIDQMIAMNPQMAGMGPQLRQMMQSDEFVDMMTNPETMRRMMQIQEAMGGSGGGGGGGLGGLGGLAGLGGMGGGQQQQQQQWPPPGAFGTPGGPGGQGQRGAEGATAGAGAGAGAGGAGGDPFAALAGLGGMGGFGGQAPNRERAMEMLNDPFMRQLMQPGAGGFGNPAGGAGSNPFAELGNLFGAGAGAGAGAGGGVGGAGGGAAPQASNLPPPEERFASQLQSLRDMGFVDGPANLRALLISGGSVEGAISVLLGGN